MSNSLQQSPFSVQSSRPYAQGMLRSLGVPVPFPEKHRGSRDSGQSFWQRPEAELLAFREQAQQKFRQRAKQLRTDLVANHDAAVQLIETWRRLKLCFSKHNIFLAQ